MRNEKATLFADDTSIVLHDKNIDRLKQQTEFTMKQVYEWLLSNRLSLSWEKTFFVIYHSPNRKHTLFNDIKVNDFMIKRVKVIKYLGMHIDENLKWDKHVNTLCNTLSRNFHLFYSIRNIIPGTLKKELYYSLIFSRIMYGIELYGSCRKTLLSKVQTIQNKLLKVLYQLPYRSNTNELHCRLELLKVEDIYKTRVLKFAYESIKNICISQFENHYQYRRGIHHHLTRNTNMLHIPRVRTKYGENTLKYKGSKFWNNITNDLHNETSIYTFKKATKRFLINNYDG